MSQTLPELEDYVRIFQVYGKDLGSIYKEECGPIDPYEMLFERIILMLIKPSSFNLSLPDEFTKTAHRYHRGDISTQKHLDNTDNRHFMLCDLHDLIMLKGGLDLLRKRDH